MSGLVVWLSLALGIGFTLAYLFIPRFKKDVESPKAIFQQQLRQYDAHLSEQVLSKGNTNEEK
jgi:thiosulfate reductase cytochrome b subunit